MFVPEDLVQVRWGLKGENSLFVFQSNDNEERLQVVKLLAKMFGAKDSELAVQNKPLWQCFLGRWAEPLTCHCYCCQSSPGFNVILNTGTC